ncbi:hydroxymethylbilane synthase [soil metagenome]
MVAPDRLRLVSRGSELALLQSRLVAEALRDRNPELEVRIETVRTTGDRVTNVPLARIGDRGLWTRELDDALLEGRADVAVHSYKDVPTNLPAGLTVAAVTTRADPRDVLLAPRGRSITLDGLSPGARVGTSALRRTAQLRARRHDLIVANLRGNLPTRLARLDAGDYDAIVLAAAGVLRLGWRERITEYLDPPGWLPAVGQGALAVVTRSGDERLRERLALLHDREAGDATTAERAFLRALEGGCQVPIAALATVEGEERELHGRVSALDGSAAIDGVERGERADAAGFGERLAAELLERGAGELLAAIRAATATVLAPAP